MALDIDGLRSALSDFIDRHHRDLDAVTADRDAALSQLAAAEGTINDLVAQLRGSVPAPDAQPEQPAAEVGVPAQ